MEVREMNKIHICNVEGIAASTKTPKGTLKLFRDTLRYLSEESIKGFSSPDDAFYDMYVYGTLSHPISIIVKLRPIKKKNRKPYGSTVNIDLEYRSDIEMSEHMVPDLQKILAHFGLPGLYNRSGKELMIKTKH